MRKDKTKKAIAFEQTQCFFEKPQKADNDKDIDKDMDKDIESDKDKGMSNQAPPGVPPKKDGAVAFK